MRSAVAMLLFAGAFTAPLVATAQDVAGRLVVVTGDVSLTRGDQKITAQRGTEVRTGDTVQLGALSNAQLLLTDESIIALRPETLFRVSEYAFQTKDPDNGRAVFNLLKGGLRTVTGFIGKRNRSAYSVNTPVATIGIRGTHYNLVHCDNSCRNPNGSLAPNGTYGGVTDGRIGVTNQSGETQFGHDQYFHVVSTTTAPQQLIAPPGFLRDKLEGRSNSSGKQNASTTGTTGGGGQQQSTTASSGDSSISASTSTTVPAVALTTNTFQVGSLVGTVGTAALVQQTFNGTVFYRVSGALNIPVTSCGAGPCGTITFGEITLGVNFAAGRASIGISVQGTGGGIRNYSSPGILGGIPITISGNQVTFNSTVDLASVPLNQGAFRCSDCGPGGTVGFATQLSISGTISGAQATLTLSAVEPNGPGAFTTTLTQATPPNNSSAAYAVRNFAGGNEARSSSYWNVALDASGRLLSFGPIVGAVSGSVGGAANSIVGSSPADGNLVWGKWGAGSNLTDFNYTSGVNPQVVPWITGDAVNNIPPSLGTQTFTMIPGSAVFRNGGDVMNSASLVADFVNRTINLNMNATSGPNTFQMNGSGGFVPTTGRFSQGFNSVTCAGPCTPGPPSFNGGFSGFFAGAQAQAAGVSFTAGNGSIGVTGVVGLRR